MDLFFYFFVIPLAVIIFSIALQKLFNNPILVASIVFAIALIVAFTAFSGSAISIIAAVIYGILSFIVAWLTNIISRFIKRLCNSNGDLDNDNDDTVTGSDNLPNTRACRICRCQRNILRNLRI